MAQRQCIRIALQKLRVRTPVRSECKDVLLCFQTRLKMRPECKDILSSFHAAFKDLSLGSNEPFAKIKSFFSQCKLKKETKPNI